MLVEWATKQCGLLDLELEEENCQLATKIQSLSAIQCQDAGLSLLHLEIDSMRTSMFGRSTITLTSDKGKDTAILQNSTFKVGDEVVLYNPKNRHTVDAQESQVNGVISKVTKCTLEIVCEDTPNEELMTPPLRMDMRSNEYTHRKMGTTLKELETSSHRLVRILIACDQVSRFEISQKAFELGSFKLFNPNLNESQISAVKCSLQAPLVSIIHGPPGTGKTATVTELILQAVARGQKVLVCAPSNVAVDNVLERVVRAATSPQWDRRTERPRVVRLGHPARVSPHTLPHCLDARIMGDEGTAIVNDVRAEMDKLRRAMCGPGRRRDKAKQREQRAEMRELRREVRTREEKVVASVLGSSNVVLCTCVGAGSRVLRDVAFELVVVDEAAQALEAACWVPILRGHRLVLAGDHLQLPPTVKSAAAEKGGLSRTLFERIIRDQERFGDVTRLLDTQYRMNSLISDWASGAMYEGKLQSDPSVANHSLEDFLLRLENTSLSMPATSPSPDEGSEGRRGVREGGSDAADADKQLNPDQVDAEISTQELVSETTAPTTHIPVLLLLDTADCGMEESEPEAANSSSRASHRNAQEAEVVLRHVHALVAAGVRPNQIGVITPYNGQLEVLKQLLLGGTTPPKEVARPNDNQSADQKGGKKTDSAGPKKGGGKDGQGPKDKGGKASKYDDDDYGRDVSPLDGVEIRTVDGFQGGEKECIVMSLVCSNRHREVGFLGDHRRINVGVTRARRHLCVVCDTDTCASDPFIRSLLEHMSRRGDHRSAEEYMAADEATIFSVFDTPAVDTAATDGDSNNMEENDGASTSGVGATSEMTSSLLKFGGVSSSRLSKGKNLPSVGEQRRNAPGKEVPRGVPSGGKPKPTSKPTIETEAVGAAAEGAQASRVGDALDPEIEAIVAGFARGAIGAGAVRLVNQHLAAPQSSLNPSAAASVPVHPNGGKKILRFPPQLNSYSRMRVHSMAEDLGLSHRSCGEGPGRFVEVSNVPFGVADDGSSVPSVRAAPNRVSAPSLAPSGSESACVGDNGPDGNTSAGADPEPHFESEINVLEQQETPLQDEVGLGKMSQLQLALAQSDDDDDDVDEPQEKSGPNGSGAGGAKKAKSKEKKVKAGASGTSGSNSGAQAYSDLKAKPVQYYIGEGRAKAMAAANEKLKSLDSQVFDDEDAALQAAIDANKAITQLHKYRVGASEMPNWEKEQAKARLHQKIEAARHKSDSESKSAAEDSSEGASAKTSRSNKKVVKKPPPNFGGGKLGSS